MRFCVIIQILLTFLTITFILLVRGIRVRFESINLITYPINNLFSWYLNHYLSHQQRHYVVIFTHSVTKFICSSFKDFYVSELHFQKRNWIFTHI